jgi:hypothetical protein
MVALDHDGDLSTDAWLCRGPSATSANWVLMRGESDGTGAAVPFSFHPTDLRCSVHDELSVAPTPGGGQRLLVVPAYADDGTPLDDAARSVYWQLAFDLDAGEAAWEPALLPRDRYQRWHDRQCRNGIAAAATGLPVYGAGLGLDRQIDINGDGLVDVLRFELASGDGTGNHAEIVEDLREDTDGLSPGAWKNTHICADAVTEHRDAVIRAWQNTGEAYVDAGIVHSFEGIAHANLWLNFVGAQLLDVNDDGLVDLVLPPSTPAGGWTLLAPRGDGTFVASGTGLPKGWPSYTDDETWEDALSLGAKVRTFGMGVDRNGDSADPDVNDERPGILFIGAIPEDEGFDWLTVANLWEPGGTNEGEHIVEIVDGLGRTTTFDYEVVDASDRDAPTGHRASLSVATWVATQMCVEAQTEAYQQDPDPAADLWSMRCTNFDYEGGVVDRWGRGLLGFEEIRTVEAGIWHEFSSTWTRYSVDADADLHDYLAVGRPLEQVVLHGADDIMQNVDDVAEISRTTWTWTHLPTPLVGGRTVTSYASEVRERAYWLPEGRPFYSEAPLPDELDDLPAYADVTTTETRDAYGTILSSVRDAALGERTEFSAAGVVHDTTDWLLGQVAHVEVESCAHAGDCKTRTSEFTYDAAVGLPATVVEEPGDPDLELTTTVLREGHGNVWWSGAAPMGGAPRVTTTAWDPEGVQPLSVINPLSQVTHVVHDTASGALRAVVEPGGTTRTFKYDGFYRETRRDRLATPLGVSDGAPTAIEYMAGADAAWPAVPGVAMRVRETTASGQRVTKHLNRLGLPVLAVWRGALAVPGAIPPTIGAGSDVYQRIRYDIYGEIGERSVPQWVGSNPLGWEHIDRDRLGRPIRAIAPDGTVLSQTTYGHHTGLVASTVVTTWDANQRSEITELVTRIMVFYQKDHASPCTARVRSPNSRSLSRISSAVLVQTKGLPSLLCTSTYPSVPT